MGAASKVAKNLRRMVNVIRAPNEIELVDAEIVLVDSLEIELVDLLQT